MKKWTNTLTLALMSAIFVLSMPKTLEGQVYDPFCESCDWNPCDFWGLEASAEFLYWLPCVDDLDYAARLTNLSDTSADSSYSQEIEYDSIHPDREPGFRVGLAINDVWCEWRLSGSYTYLEASESSLFENTEETIVVSPFQFAALTNAAGSDGDGGFDQVFGKYSLDYQSWDVILSRAVCSSECYVIAPFFGVEGVILDQKIKTESELKATNQDPESETNPFPFPNGYATTKWTSDFSACGVKFGTDYIYRLSDCLKFFTRGSFTIATGENDGKNHQELGRNVDSSEEERVVQTITATEDDGCRFVNGYHIQTGFILESEVCGCEFSIRAGYEFLKWHNVPKPRRFPSGDSENDDAYNRSISTSPGNSTIGFHGFLVGVALGF